MSLPNAFRADFIGSDLIVNLPIVNNAQRDDLVMINEPATPEIDYPHFTLYLSKSRRFPYFTATNIDGDLFKPIPRKKVFGSGRDEWSLDSRFPDYQWGAKLYSADKSDFQRGHMTKREDPQWGDTEAEALAAAQATYHFSNCVPQLGDLNTKEWGKLETYILSKESVPGKLKVSVLTGPVLSPQDPLFVTSVEGEQIPIPTLFWKVVYYSNNGRDLSRAAFLMGQENELFRQKIVMAKTHVDLFKAADSTAPFFQDFVDAAIYQVNMSTIELLTGLKFTDANEPYKDARPLKLIIDKVQVKADQEISAAIHALDRENFIVPKVIDKDDEYIVSFNNLILAAPPVITVAAASTNNDAALQPTVSSFTAAGPQFQYTNDLKKHFGYYATWNPGLHLQLGDIGILQGNVFTRIGHLRFQKINFEVNADDTTPADISYKTEGAVNVTTKLSGTAALPGSILKDTDAGLTIEFNKKNAIFFEADQTLTSTIADTIGLGEAVLKSFEDGKWDKNWVVITELVTAKAATILISSLAGAKIELKVTTSVSAPAIDLADASLGLSTQFSKSMDTTIIAQAGITPLFKAMKIRTPLFGEPNFEPLNVSAFDLLTPQTISIEENKQRFKFAEI